MHNQTWSQLNGCVLTIYLSVAVLEYPSRQAFRLTYINSNFTMTTKLQ